MRQPVSAVVFDIGNVLVRWDRRLPFVGRFASEAELEHFLDVVIPIAWHGQHDAGRPAAEMVAERSAQFPEYAGAIADWFARFNESIPGPIPGSPEIVAELAARGMPLYGLTNFGADTWAGYRPTQPLFDALDDIVVSGIEKLAKPDPAIYALAAARFGHDPAGLLFIDDSAANVVAAREAGWQAHHFTDAASLRSELAERALL